MLVAIIAWKVIFLYSSEAGDVILFCMVVLLMALAAAYYIVVRTRRN